MAKFILAMLALSTVCFAGEVPKNTENVAPKADFLKTDKDVASYVYGHTYGVQFAVVGPMMNTEKLAQGFKEGAVDKGAMTQKELQGALTELQTYAQDKVAADAKVPPVKMPDFPSKDKASYALGQYIGSNFVGISNDLDADLASNALVGAINGDKPKINLIEAQKTVKAYLDTVSAKYKKEGEEFLAVNAKKEGVKATGTGLQYKVLREGNGAKPLSSQAEVEVHYEGKLLNGKVFDSSYQRGETATFPLNQVIKGWTEGLQLMNEGSKYELYIPGDLGYPGGNAKIPPMATLIFQVELIKIRANPPPDPATQAQKQPLTK